MSLSKLKRASAGLAAIIMAITLAACSAGEPAQGSSSLAEPSSVTSQQAQPVTITDREGNTITLPPQVDKIISMAPSITETLVHLGMADKLVAVDTYSAQVEGVSKDIPVFDMMTPDTESIAALAPDIILATGMSRANGDDPFKAVTDLGVLMTYIPSSESIDGIKQDIIFLGDVTGTGDKARAIVTDMEKEIAEITAKVADIKTDKSVYFEIAAAPAAYSFGTGTFLNEMIELLGATNILADQQSWVSVSEEVVLQKNPDVIFTNVDYIDNPVGEILGRSGWNVIGAVKNKQVFSVDKNASSRSNEYITAPFRQMAAALYPEAFD